MTSPGPEISAHRDVGQEADRAPSASGVGTRGAGSFSVPRLWFLLIVVVLCLSGVSWVGAEETADTSDEVPSQTEPATRDEDSDDTADVDTESTVDTAEDRRGFKVAGDLRPIIDYFDIDGRDVSSASDGGVGGRIRLGADFGIFRSLHLGVRAAGRCFTQECDPEWVLESATPGPNGLSGGQVTLDQIYLHWFRLQRFNLAVGRLQTRFVLRGGVYAKSLDRNDSNNVNITWTDGLHATFQNRGGWTSSFVLQRNAANGTGSIRHSPLDFDDGRARNTYFLGFEKTSRERPVAQLAFDASYLPGSLLEDGNPEGRRTDYWGLVGRLALRWPQRSEGIRLRVGGEVGYAPEAPTAEAVGLDGDVNQLAWNVVASLMDFTPDHSVGLNYARTGAAWLLSPQYRPNESLFEIRYQWWPRRWPLLEARVRWREDLEQLTDRARKRAFDFYLRVTWEFDVKRR